MPANQADLFLYNYKLHWLANICLRLAFFSLLSASLWADNHALQNDKLTVAVAANFLHAFKEIQEQYTEETGIKVITSHAATGQLYHQIRHGAPFDIFLSADRKTSQRLINEKLALASSYFVYARGRLVLWSADQSIELANGGRLTKLDKNTAIAMANPKIAPYGKAAQQVLEQLDAQQNRRATIVTGQNITQTYQFIASGNAAMGFISLAQLRAIESAHKKENYWLVPESLHDPIEQSAVVIARSKKAILANNFLNFLRSPKALNIMQKYGYR